MVNYDDSYRMSLLFRSIYENPPLASHIQHVRITEELYDLRDSIELPFTINTINSSDIQRFQDTVTADLSGFPQFKDLRNGIGVKGLDPLMAILLSRLNNLRTLRLHYSIAFRFHLTGILLKHYKAHFSRMEEISVWNEDGIIALESMHWNKEDIPRDFLILPFTMPMMKTIEMILPDPDYHFPFAETVVERLPFPEAVGVTNLRCLTTLRLLNTQVTVSTVGKILDYTPSLEIFEYNFVQE